MLLVLAESSESEPVPGHDEPIVAEDVEALLIQPSAWTPTVSELLVGESPLGRQYVWTYQDRRPCGRQVLNWLREGGAVALHERVPGVDVGTVDGDREA